GCPKQCRISGCVRERWNAREHSKYRTRIYSSHDQHGGEPDSQSALPGMESGIATGAGSEDVAFAELRGKSRSSRGGAESGPERVLRYQLSRTIRHYRGAFRRPAGGSDRSAVLDGYRNRLRWGIELQRADRFSYSPNQKLDGAGKLHLEPRTR